MKKEDQWVCWRTEERNGKSRKVPINPYTGGYAKANDVGTWSDFDTALQYYRRTRDVDGVGFMFQEGGLYAGVDLDDCRDLVTGEVDEWALEIIQELDSYTEESPSGTGFHVIVYGFVPDGGNRRGSIEMYDRHRYFTVTGKHVFGTPQTVEQRANRLRDIHREYIVDRNQERGAVQQEERPQGSIPDHELIEKAVNAANGDKFQALWNGDTSGYKSHSEADQALCNLLAFWTGGDPQQIDNLFSRSSLVREKWRKRADYRERTIKNAIRSCSEFYEPEDEEEV